jgi:hypothetical protein
MLAPAGLAAHAAAGQAFHEADDRFMASLAIDEDTARASLAAIGDAAVVATDLLAAASMEATA